MAITSTATKRHREAINVGQQERLASMVGGGTLVVYGLSKRSWAGLGLAAIGGALVYRGTTGHCDMYQSLGLNTAKGWRGRNASVPYELGIRVDKTISIFKPRAEVYKFWRNLENLPKFMRHLESVKEIDNKTSHWVAKAPAGTSVEWKAEIINEVENELLAWRSLDGDVSNAGSVQFRDAPGDRGTELKIQLQYNPPGGTLGAAIAKLFGEEPSMQINDDLRRFKQLIETGEISTTEGQASGRRPESEKRRGSKKGWVRDEVGEASEESFPASDPPAWTPAAATR